MSTNEETESLYARSNRNFFFNSLKEKRCPQSNQICLLIDKDQSDTRLNYLTNHLDRCPICSAKLEEMRVFSLKIDSLIPNYQMTEKMADELEIQLKNIKKEARRERAIPSERPWWRFF